ncbi:MAG: hypothetical protein LBI14_03425 [Treponema sp.]|jgi:hypothetical protein|nr:hypothetical protein [Treponema sp.]
MKIAVGVSVPQEMRYIGFWKNFFEGTRWQNPRSFSEILIRGRDGSFLANDFSYEYEEKGNYRKGTIDEIASLGYMLVPDFTQGSWTESPTPVAVFDKGIPLGKTIIVKGLAIGNDPSVVGSLVCGYTPII